MIVAKKNQTPERLQAALEEIDALCRKLGVVIDGCGCCGSPWLRFAGPEHTRDVREKCISPGDTR